MIPTLMNCEHCGEGWCLSCVEQLAESTISRQAVADALDKMRAEIHAELNECKTKDDLPMVLVRVRAKMDAAGETLSLPVAKEKE